MRTMTVGRLKNFYFAPGDSFTLGVNRFLVCSVVPRSSFSSIHTEDFGYSRMYGLPRGAGRSDVSEEVNISDQRFWGYQLHIARKTWAINKIRNRPDAKSDVQTAMAFLRDHYNRRQQSASHDGPPIVRLRMYDHRWKLRSDLSTLDAPYRRTVLAESPLVEE